MEDKTNSMGKAGGQLAASTAGTGKG